MRTVRMPLGSARALLHFDLRFSDFFVRRILDASDMVPRIFGRENQFVELQLQSQRVTVLRRLDQKTIRNVTIVVPVLMTSCQVSLNPNKGPVTAQTSTTATAKRKVAGRPEIREAQLQASRTDCLSVEGPRTCSDRQVCAH